MKVEEQPCCGQLVLGNHQTRIKMAAAALRSTRCSMRSLSSAQAIPSRLLYTEEQMKKGRPISPHVTIYKFPAPAISSITNRTTGVMLSAGNSVLVLNSHSVMIAVFNRCSWYWGSWFV
jgi:hypothetical protein